MNTEQLYQVYLQYPSVQTDTRKLQKNDLFFALKGPHFNGNGFAAQALEQGAAYAIVDEPAHAGSDRTILVDDVLMALQDLSRYHRLQFNIPFVAITGSNGKTSSKELLHAVLSSTYKTYSTQGNLNNHIGIPLSLLQVNPDAEMAVIEMGANHQKEIEGYCRYCLPTHGIITNAGKAHLEGFGGIEGVRKGKAELYDFLRKEGGTAFVMWDYDYLRAMSKGIAEIVRYGEQEGADIVGTAGQGNAFLRVTMRKGVDFDQIQTKLVGDYNLPNVLAAVAVGKHFKVPDGQIRKAIENYTPSNSRSQLIERGSNKIILDAYNANPGSMKAAITNFAAFPAENKILMLGAMAELGAESMDEHLAILSLIEEYPWKEVVLVGGDFMKIKHPYRQFENAAEAGAWLQKQGFHDSCFLVKGSRSMQMEKAIRADGAGGQDQQQDGPAPPCPA